MTSIPDPYDRTEFRGRPLDYATAAGCVLMELSLGYRLTIMQGIGGAPQSAGTHLGAPNPQTGKMEGGRFVDLAPYDADRKERAARDILGIGWVRPENWDHAGGGEHVHCGNIFIARGNDRGIAPAGFRQIGYYDRGLDGLVDMAKDPHPYRPTPKIALSLDQYEHVMRDIGLDAGPMPTRVTKQRDALVEADADLGVFIGLAKHDGAPPADWKWAQKERVLIRHRLDTMAKR